MKYVVEVSDELHWPAPSFFICLCLYLSVPVVWIYLNQEMRDKFLRIKPRGPGPGSRRARFNNKIAPAIE